MRNRCSITVELGSEKDAAAALAALKQEEEFKRRSDSSISVSGKEVSVVITADDVVALRATANSYLRALQAIISVDGGNEDE